MYSLTDTASIFRYHKDMIVTYGNNNTHALGWRNPESQSVRFEQLIKIADLNNHSVLDAGCGHGDLCEYLRQVYPQSRYFGVEQIPELLDVAIKRYADWPETVFYQGDFLLSDLPVADYVIVCGSLNYRSSDDQFIFKAISKLFAGCRYGLGFNLLSQIAENGLLVTYNMDEIAAYCRTLSKHVVVKNDYSDEDFTILMYH